MKKNKAFPKAHAKRMTKPPKAGKGHLKAAWRHLINRYTAL
jgi:hypothetical protein